MTLPSPIILKFNPNFFTIEIASRLLLPIKSGIWVLFVFVCFVFSKEILISLRLIFISFGVDIYIFFAIFLKTGAATVDP